MSQYSIVVVTNEILSEEPLKIVMDDRSLKISSMRYCKPAMFESTFLDYKSKKVYRNDLIIFRDDIPRESIFNYVTDINYVSRKNGDTWWGIIAYKYNDKDEENWMKIGCKYYGSATSFDGFSNFLKRLTLKQSNYDRYTRSK